MIKAVAQCRRSGTRGPWDSGQLLSGADFAWADLPPSAAGRRHLRFLGGVDGPCAAGIGEVAPLPLAEGIPCSGDP